MTWWSAVDSTTARQYGAWVCCMVFDVMYSSVYMYVYQRHGYHRLIPRHYVTMAALTLALIKWKLRCVGWHKTKSVTRWFRVIMVGWGLDLCVCLLSTFKYTLFLFLHFFLLTSKWLRLGNSSYRLRQLSVWTRGGSQWGVLRPLVDECVWLVSM